MTIQQLYYHRAIIVGTLLAQLIVDELYHVRDLPVTLSNFITIMIIYVMVRGNDETQLTVEKHRFNKNRLKSCWKVFTLTILSTFRIALNSMLRDSACQDNLHKTDMCTGTLLSLFMSYVVMMLSFSDNWLMLCFFTHEEPVVIQRRVEPQPAPAA
ncbi:hypothetical protein L596_001621 [Steinernema carpocapsae]|nr:hypothetical protein L596_001621 [Steinernema carpocapsae]